MFKKSTLLLFVAVVVLSMLPLSMTVSAQNPDCEGDVNLTYWHRCGIVESLPSAIRLVRPMYARLATPKSSSSQIAKMWFTYAKSSLHRTLLSNARSKLFCMRKSHGT